jgi:hypothetical protein
LPQQFATALKYSAMAAPRLASEVRRDLLIGACGTPPGMTS